MYHTQEKWQRKLNNPIQCTRHDAWLGVGYYFWEDEIDAIHWGHNSKRKKRYFEIYKAEIDCENILDTVFNEEQYQFWKAQVEKAAKHISKRTGCIATIKEINQYFNEKALWLTKLDGILFNDNPSSDDLLVKGLLYRKRIQIVVYNLKIVRNFVFHDELECN